MRAAPTCSRRGSDVCSKGSDTPVNALLTMGGAGILIAGIWGAGHLGGALGGTNDPVALYVECSTMGTIVVLVVYVLTARRAAGLRAQTPRRAILAAQSRRDPGARHALARDPLLSSAGPASHSPTTSFPTSRSLLLGRRGAVRAAAAARRRCDGRRRGRCGAGRHRSERRREICLPGHPLARRFAAHTAKTRWSKRSNGLSHSRRRARAAGADRRGVRDALRRAARARLELAPAGRRDPSRQRGSGSRCTTSARGSSTSTRCRSWGRLAGAALVAVTLITTASLYLNGVFGFAVAETPPDVSRGFAGAAANRWSLLIPGLVVGAMLACSALLRRRCRGRGRSSRSAAVVGLMMVGYVAVPARAIGLRRNYKRTDKWVMTAISSTIGGDRDVPRLPARPNRPADDRRAGAARRSASWRSSRRSCSRSARPALCGRQARVGAHCAVKHGAEDAPRS